MTARPPQRMPARVEREREGSRARTWLLATCVVGALFTGWVLGRLGEAEPEPQAGVDRMQAVPEDLTLLRDEVAMLRGDLDARIAGLEHYVSELDARMRSAEAATESAGALLPAAPEPEEGEAAEAPAGRRRAFDSDGLVDEGIRPEDAERLRALWEELEMEKLRLSDLAAREGWAKTPEYYRELWELDQAPRRELDDATYDQYLYASRRPNRVVVRDVIERSSAAGAGFLPRDTILRYDGRRIFSVENLNEAARRGSLGQSVQVEVLRDGRRLGLDVPRGPLGVVLSLQRQPPLID